MSSPKNAPSRARLALIALLCAAAPAQATSATEITDADALDAQPHMKSALSTLESAKRQLEKATHDKGGHRAKALGYVNQAIAEVKAGIKFDNQH